MTRVQHAGREQKDASKGEQITEFPQFPKNSGPHVLLCNIRFSLLWKEWSYALKPFVVFSDDDSQLWCSAAAASLFIQSETDKSNDQNKSKNKYLHHKPQQYDTLLVLYHTKLSVFNPVNYWLIICWVNTGSELA